MITWRKSSHSDETGGACIELTHLRGTIAVRDSKAPGSGHLILTPRAFATLVQHLKRDTYPR